MLTIQIEVPEVIEVTSRDRMVSCDVAMLPLTIASRAMVEGIRKSVIDSASQAGTAAARDHFNDDRLPGTSDKAKAWLATEAGKKASGDLTETIMQKRLDAYYKDEWEVRGQGPGDRGLAILRMFKAMLTDAEGKTFNKLSASDQVRKAVDNAAKHEALFPDADVESVIQEIAAEREARKTKAASEKAKRQKLRGNVKFAI